MVQGRVDDYEESMPSSFEGRIVNERPPLLITFFINQQGGPGVIGQ